MAAAVAAVADASEMRENVRVKETRERSEKKIGAKNEFLTSVFMMQTVWSSQRLSPVILIPAAVMPALVPSLMPPALSLSLHRLSVRVLVCAKLRRHITFEEMEGERDVVQSKESKNDLHQRTFTSLSPLPLSSALGSTADSQALSRSCLPMCMPVCVCFRSLCPSHERKKERRMMRCE